jgi:GNAT superfamily N-acetyltransferase
MRVTEVGVTVIGPAKHPIARMMVDDQAPAGTWSVKSIFVFPGERGKGIATAMLRGFADACRKPLVFPTEPVTDEGSALFDSFLPPLARTP